jgi:hypothetical protein
MADKPPEQDLEALLKAFEAGDRTNLFRLLEKTTIYSTRHLEGFANLLAQTQEKPGDLGQLDSIASNTLTGLQEFRPPTGLSAEERERLNKAAEDYRAQAAKFAEELNRIRGGRLGVLPQQISRAIRRNYQYFNGWWIRDAKLLAQEGLDSAVITLRYFDESSAIKLGVFRIDNSANLTLLGQYEIPEDPSDRAASTERAEYYETKLQYFKTLSSEEMIFSPREGIGRLANGKIDWVDRSDTFKTIHKYLGADKQGRLYFASPAAEPAHGLWPVNPGTTDGALWVYRLNAEPRSAAPHVLFPLMSMPMRDSSNRVWFLAPHFAGDRYSKAWHERAGTKPFRDGAAGLGKASSRQLEIKVLTNTNPS